MKQRTMCNVLPLGQEMENIYVYIQIFLFVHKNLSSVSSVQSLSHVQLFATPWAAARQASLSITNSQSLLKLMSIEWMMPSNRLILCYPLLLWPSIFPSIRETNGFFTSDGQSTGASASASVLPLNIQGWFPLGLNGLILLLSKELPSLLQHHNWKASILWC